MHVCFSHFFLKKKVTDLHQVSRAQLQINNSVLSYTSRGSACKSAGIINAIASRDIPIWLLLNENRTGSFCQKFFFWVDQKSLWAVCLCVYVCMLIVPPPTITWEWPLMMLSQIAAPYLLLLKIKTKFGMCLRFLPVYCQEILYLSTFGN